MLTTLEKVFFLKSVDLFSQLHGDDLAQVAGIAQEITFEGGELVFQEGDSGDSMYLIIEGQIMVHRLGKELSRLGEKQGFGEMAILDNEPRSASVTALTDVTCLKVEQGDFFELMSEKIEIAHGIIRLLGKRLRDTNRKIAANPSD